MKIIRIELPLLLPQLVDERDHCLDKIILLLKKEKGISKVHLHSAEPLEICIHFNPDQVSLVKVKQIAERNGAMLTNRFGHILLDVNGIRHQRQAQEIGKSLSQIEGIVGAHASTAGTLRIEWDKTILEKKQILLAIDKLGLTRLSNKPIGFKSKIDLPNHGHERNLDDDHNHIEASNIELYLAIASGLFWVAGILFSLLDDVANSISIMCYVIGLACGGYFIAIEAWSDLKRGRFRIDFLMLFAAVGAVFLGEWSEATLLLFLFSLGHALEHYAMKRARRSITALSDLSSPTAVLKQGEELREVPVTDLKIGDLILVKPNSKVAADGVVSSGQSSVDQSPITGESVPVDKYAPAKHYANYDLNALPNAHKVFAGTINGSSTLEVTVLKLSTDSTISRLIDLIKEAETHKSSTQNFAEKFEYYYVPIVLVFVTVLLFAPLVIDETFSQSFYRAMAVLIAASPCALAISTPSAVLAGIARGAKAGVLFKGGKSLDDLGKVKAIAFDKTGTLTQGKPKLTHVIPFGKTSKEELLAAAVAVESLSDHQLAAAIAIEGRNQLNQDVREAKNLKALTARGVRASWQGSIIHIGNRRLFSELPMEDLPPEIESKMSEIEGMGHTAMIVSRDQEYIGLVCVMDIARENAKSTIAHLKDMGISRPIMLTGDNQRVADAIGAQVGIPNPLGDLLPEDKVTAIEQLMKELQGGVAMVGDGVNDAPALARSSVGIAMGAAGSDVALETADIALMGDQLDKLPFAIGLSRMARKIIVQNIWISMGMVCILIPLTLLGFAEIGPAVVAHEGSTVAVVLNALRLLAFQNSIS